MNNAKKLTNLPNYRMPLVWHQPQSPKLLHHLHSTKYTMKNASFANNHKDYGGVIDTTLCKSSFNPFISDSSIPYITVLQNESEKC